MPTPSTTGPTCASPCPLSHSDCAAPMAGVPRSSVMTGGNIEKEPQPPRWAVWVARAIAVVIVVPAKLAWEALKAAGRVVRRVVLRPLLAALKWVATSVGALARFVWRWLFAPVGRGLGYVLDGLGAGLRAVGRFLVRYLFRPLGVFLPILAERLDRGLDAVVSALSWVFSRLSRFALRPAGRGLRWLARGLWRVLAAVGRAVGRAVRVVVIIPLVWCWRTLVLVPLRWIGIGLRHLGTALVWLLRRLGWALLVPLRWLWERVVVPVFRLFGDAVVWAFRRVAAPLWRLLVRVFRWVFVTPVKWIYRAVLTPVGRGLRQVMRTLVVRPALWVRASVIDPVRLAGRRVRGQLRAALGRRGN